MANSNTRAPGAAPSERSEELPPRDRDQNPVSAARAQSKAEEVESAATRPAAGAGGDRPEPVTGRGHLEGSPDPAGAGGPTGGPAAAAGGDQNDERRRRISERAYYRAQQRGFSPGGEDGDWLDAEKEIDGPDR